VPGRVGSPSAQLRRPRRSITGSFGSVAVYDGQTSTTGRARACSIQASLLVEDQVDGGLERPLPNRRREAELMVDDLLSRARHTSPFARMRSSERRREGAVPGVGSIDVDLVVDARVRRMDALRISEASASPPWASLSVVTPLCPVTFLIASKAPTVPMRTFPCAPSRRASAPASSLPSPAQSSATPPGNRVDPPRFRPA
jgi:hypothetical protein